VAGVLRAEFVPGGGPTEGPYASGGAFTPVAGFRARIGRSFGRRSAAGASAAAAFSVVHGLAPSLRLSLSESTSASGIPWPGFRAPNLFREGGLTEGPCARRSFDRAGLSALPRCDRGSRTAVGRVRPRKGHETSSFGSHNFLRRVPSVRR